MPKPRAVTPSVSSASVPEPGPIPYDRVHGLTDSNIQQEVTDYLATAEMLKSLEEEQAKRRLLVLTLLQKAGVRSVTAGPGVATVVKGKETTKIDRKKLLQKVGPAIFKQVTVTTTGEPSVRIAPISAQEVNE